MKTNAIVRIVVYSILIVILSATLFVGMLVNSLAVNFNFGYSSQISGTRASSGTVEAKDVEKIDIDWVAGTLIIQPGDTDQITFWENDGLSVEEQMIWELSGSRLTIQYMKPRVFFGISIDRSKDLVITVPRDWICSSLEINAAAAEVEVIDLTAQSVEFDTAADSCTFRNCHFTSLDLDAAACEIHFTGTLEKLDCDGAAARINAVFTNIPTSIDIDGATAELDITLPADCGFRVSMDGLSNQFSSDFPTSSSNGSYTYGNESCRIEVDGMSSNVTIRKGES